MKVCTKCKEEKPYADFNREAAAGDGLKRHCRACQAETRKAHYERNREKSIATTMKWFEEHPERKRELNLEYRRRRSERVISHFGGKCKECGSTKSLELDHVNNDGAEHRRKIGISTRGGDHFYQYLVRNDFGTDGYELQVLCKECHVKKTADEKRRKAA